MAVCLPGLTHSLLCRPKPAARMHVEFSGQNGVRENLNSPPICWVLLLFLFWISIVLVNQSKYVFCAYFNKLSTPPQSYERSVIFHGGPCSFAERVFRFRCNFWRFRSRNELSRLRSGWQKSLWWFGLWLTWTGEWRRTSEEGDEEEHK